jgi:hypothetical protein
MEHALPGTPLFDMTAEQGAASKASMIGAGAGAFENKEAA